MKNVEGGNNMYCPNCGNKIPDLSAFCSECGKKCNENVADNIKTSSSINFSKHLNYILEILKHPVTTMKNGVDGISEKVNLIYIAIITIIIPLINVVALKNYSFNLVKSIIETISVFGGEKIPFKEMIDFKYQFNQVVEQFFPFREIYTVYLLNYILFYGLIVLTIILMYKILFKINLGKCEIIRILVVFSIINLVIALIGALSLVTGLMLTITIGIFGRLFSIILLYIGFKNLLEDENKFVYLFTTIYTIASIISSYITVKYIISVCISENLTRFAPYIEQML